MISKDEIIQWLREGNDHIAAGIMEHSEFELDYVDSTISMITGEDSDLYNIQMHCPRSAFEKREIYKDELHKIEKTFAIIMEARGACAYSFKWSPIIPRSKEEKFIISGTSITELARIITGDSKVSPYRTGSSLVDFFNNFSDKKEKYEQGFPTRFSYARDKIHQLNDLNLIKPVIEAALNPRQFLHTAFDVSKVSENLNIHLAYDDLKVIKIGTVYVLQKTNTESISSNLFNQHHDINTLYIIEHLSKCDKKLSEGDFSGAITNARSLVENILLELEEKTHPADKKYNGDINKLYSKLYKTLNLDPANREITDSMRELMSGLISMVNGLAGLRNSASDAHGSRYTPKQHHAKLAVNSAKTISDFLVESYQYQKEKGFLKIQK